MAQIYKCDLCGKITDTVAAKIILRVNPLIAKELPRNYRNSYDESEFDCCEACYVEKFTFNSAPLTIATTGIVDL